MSLLKRLIVEEEGQGLVEYSLILALVVIVLYAAITISGIDEKVKTLWADIAKTVESAPEGS